VARFPDLAWWYWATLTLLLAAAAVWPAADRAALALAGAQTVHFYARAGRSGALPVQVRIAYLGILAAGFWSPLALLHWFQLAATLARVAFDYCVLARTLALMPWNRRAPLTFALVRRAYLTPPFDGSILAVLAGQARPWRPSPR
jgi:hypothetical protein